jgi:hypothetical protein
LIPRRLELAGVFRRFAYQAGRRSLPPGCRCCEDEQKNLVKMVRCPAHF